MPLPPTDGLLFAKIARGDPRSRAWTPRWTAPWPRGSQRLAPPCAVDSPDGRPTPSRVLRPDARPRSPGATSGLGLGLTASGCACLGAHVRLAVRDTEKAARVRVEIESQAAGAEAVGRPAPRLRPRGRAPLRRGPPSTGSTSSCTTPARCPPPGPSPRRATSDDGAARARAGADDRAAQPSPDQSRQPGDLRDLGRDVLAQRLRPDDPEYLDGGVLPTTAYARSKRAQAELLPLLRQQVRRSRCSGRTRPIRAGPTRRAWRSRCRRFHQLTGPLLRDAWSGADTTVWMGATQPELTHWGELSATTAAPTRPTPPGAPARATPNAPGCGTGCVTRSTWTRARDDAGAGLRFGDGSGHQAGDRGGTS